jgi:hypothetical protein
MSGNTENALRKALGALTVGGVYEWATFSEVNPGELLAGALHFLEDHGYINSSLVETHTQRGENASEVADRDRRLSTPVVSERVDGDTSILS